MAILAAAPVVAAPWDGEWEGTFTHPDLACSPCKVQVTVNDGIAKLRSSLEFPDFTIAKNGSVAAELTFNPAGNLGRSVCRLAGRTQSNIMAASGSCGSQSAQAELALKRTSAPPAASVRSASESAAVIEMPAVAPPPPPAGRAMFPAPADFGARTQPFRLGRVSFDIKPGTVFGRTKTTSLFRPCSASLESRKHTHEATSVPDMEISNIEFERVMAAAGYPVRSHAAPQEPARYLVLGKVSHMDLTYCTGESSRTGDGEGSMTVDWTVVSMQGGVILYQTTVASAVRLASGEHSRDGMRELFAVTYRHAVRRLAADYGFRNAVAGYAITNLGARANQDPPIELRTAPRLTGGITANMKNILSSVVEIKRNDGTGTAFVIDSRGYLLTAAHAAGDAGTATVRFSDGQTMEAEVVRRDSLRDVALLKVERAGLRPIPLRMGKVTLTEKVFAVGHPLGLTQTVTDGIVSAYRTVPQNAQLYIQASVNGTVGSAGGPLLDANGNVIGISASAAAGAPGLSFFIPVESALERLSLRIGG